MDKGISRILNAAATKRMAEAGRLTQKTVIESSRLLFTGIASELPRFADDKAAQDLWQDISATSPHYRNGISFLNREKPNG